MKTQNRFNEFSMLKAITIMGLPFVHLVVEPLSWDLMGTDMYALAPFLVALVIFGPTVFMLCMGFGLAGGRTSVRQLRREAVQFLLIGLLLNLLRVLLPRLVLKVFVNYDFAGTLEECLNSDIYYFVGLFFLLYSFLLQWKVSLNGTILITVLMFTANMALSKLLYGKIENGYLVNFIGNFVNVDDQSNFPLLSWAIFPTMGLWLGTVLKHTDAEERKHFMRRMLAASVVVLASVTVFRWTRGLPLDEIKDPSNSMVDLTNAVTLACLALVIVSLAYELCRKISGSRFLEFTLRISSSIIVFYLLQWILVSWEMCALHLCGMPEGGYHLPLYFISAVVIIAVCIFVSLKFGMRIMKPLLKIVSPWNYGRSRKKRAAKSAKGVNP